MSTANNKPPTIVIDRRRTATLEARLREAFPGAFADADANGCWDYKIHSPLSLEDLAHIEVELNIGRDKCERSYKLVLDF